MQDLSKNSREISNQESVSRNKVIFEESCIFTDKISSKNINSEYSFSEEKCSESKE